MCGMFATVTLDESIDLPHFPEWIDRSDLSWQSKRGIDRYSGPYRVNADGRLEEKHKAYRDKTEAEKLDEAQKWGYNSWEAYADARTEEPYGGDGGRISQLIEYHDELPPGGAFVSEQTVEDEYWVDQETHGTVEIHQVVRRGSYTESPISEELSVTSPDEYQFEFYFSYELTFKHGTLDDVLFCGTRHNDFDSVQEAAAYLNSFDPDTLDDPNDDA